MLARIARLLFGGDEETPDVVKSAEGLQEGWLVVPHQGAVSCENQDALLIDVQQSGSALHEDSNMGRDSSSDADVTALGSGASTGRVASGSLPQTKAPAELTRLMRVKKTKAWPDRQHVSRNAIQRHNHVGQRVPPPSFHLQQPGRRSLDR